jgi:hypothetical protein
MIFIESAITGYTVSKYTSKKAHAFLKSENHELEMLFGKMSALASLNEKITPHIPAGLRAQCQVANAYDDRLILIAANGSIATQLRFQSMDILRKLKQDSALAHIKEIVCKVRPSSTSTTRSLRQSRSMQPLSVETAEIVHQIAESIEDPNLRRIMQRIASRNKNAK